MCGFMTILSWDLVKIKDKIYFMFIVHCNMRVLHFS